MASKNENKAPSSSHSVELQEDKLIKDLEDLQEKFAKEEADKLETIEELKRSKQELASAKEEIQSLVFAGKQTMEINKRLHQDVSQILEMVDARNENFQL